MRISILLSILLSTASPSLALAGDANYSGPVFDTHLHYSSTAWASYSPKEVLAKLDKSNVTRALVSSTPDDGTAMLSKLAPTRVIPGLRPYRTSAEKVGWYKKQELVTYAKTRLAPRRHRAFGEVILNYPDDLDTPQMAEYFDIAAEQNLVLHLHTSAQVVEALFIKRPQLKVLWAHAGFSEPAAVVLRMLDQYPNLWAELSYRADDIMGGSDLEPQWRELLMRHSERFTIGSDTWENGRWSNYQYLIDQHREWLGKLPTDVAEKIAHENARQLFN